MLLAIDVGKDNGRYTQLRRPDNQLIGKEKIVLVEGYSKKSEQYLAGRTDTNKVVIFPYDSSIKTGDYIKVKINNKVEYKANTDHPLFGVLRKVVLKHLGLEDLVETVLERMGDVDQIILVGDYLQLLRWGWILVEHLIFFDLI